LEHHTDLYQMWANLENAIVYDVRATNLTQVQSIFLQPSSGVRGELTNSAFVKMHIENERVARGDVANFGGTPWSQAQGIFSHVILSDLFMPNQRFMFRTDMGGDGRFQGENVVLRDSTIHWATYDALLLGDSAPEGVLVEGLTRGPE
jgi:hypothetical protein